jgi:hypothetical protein
MKYTVAERERVSSLPRGERETPFQGFLSVLIVHTLPGREIRSHCRNGMDPPFRATAPASRHS